MLTATDLLAILGLGPSLAVAAVKGKVDEAFGPLIEERLDDSPAKQRRIAALTALLDVTGSTAATLRYQRFHRTAAAVYEA